MISINAIIYVLQVYKSHPWRHGYPADTRPLDHGFSRQALPPSQDQSFTPWILFAFATHPCTGWIDSLNECIVNAQFISLGNQHQRLTESSLDQLAGKNSPTLGPKPLVVVDAFCNALLKLSSYEGDMMDNNFAIRPQSKHTKRRPMVFHSQGHTWLWTSRHHYPEGSG